MDAMLKVPYPYDVRARPIQFVQKRGHWKVADPSGVECSFCGCWQRLPIDICPKCGAVFAGAIMKNKFDYRR